LSARWEISSISRIGQSDRKGEGVSALWSEAVLMWLRNILGMEAVQRVRSLDKAP
jgi:hypothetical protein